MLVTKCSMLTIFLSVLGTAFYAGTALQKSAHRNKTIKSNSKHDNAIKDSQHNILCTIGYYSSIVIDMLKRSTLWTRIWRKSCVHIVGHGILSEKSSFVENAKTNACLSESCNTSSKGCNR